MRNLASFWDYSWIDTSLRGARGRGTWLMFETLRLHGGGGEGGDLAAEHVWFRLIGARHHEGLRQELRRWYGHNDREQRRRKVLDHRAQYGKPHHVEVLFDWLDHIAERLRPFIAAGSEDAKVRLTRVENEVAKSRAKFAEDLLE